jgi:hypothetical protein
MPQEVNLYAIWAGKQTAKGTENTTPAHRFVQVGGDIAMSRDEGTEDWSDLSKYGGQTQWINSLTGGGTPALEATPSEIGALLWLMHGGETATVGTDQVQTITAGTATGGTFTLSIYDGVNTILVSGLAFSITSAALDTAIEAALAAAGYAANQVACAGGPLNTTPITVTFNGTQTAKRPWALMVVDGTLLTGGTSPVVTNTTPGVRTKHTFTPSPVQGFWVTFVRRVGGTSYLQRHSFLDCIIGGLTLEGSTATKALRMSPTVLSLDPAKVLSADPAQALPTGIDLKPFLYTDATSAFVFAGVALPSQSEFTFTLNEDRQPVYGDDAVPYDLAVGNPSALLSVTAIFDSLTGARWNELAYGTAVPTAGTKPLRSVAANIAYSMDFQQKDGKGNLTGNRLKITIPVLHCVVPDAPAPNAAGGNVTVTFAGTILPPGGAGQPYTIDVYNADQAAYTV